MFIEISANLGSGTQVSIHFEVLFGSHADGREVGARFYGMSIDPEPIRIGHRGIRVDPQPDRGESLQRSGYLTTNQKKPFQHRSES